MPKPLPIYILSGGTGRTGESVLQAALAQFESPRVRIVPKTHLRSVPSALKAVREAAEEQAIVLHTLVVPKIRQAVVKEAEKRMVPSVDLLGPALTALSDYLETSPRNRPGLSYELQKEHFDRVDAVDFTLAHDDGNRLGTIDRADVVLVGVSRVSKSVTCFYLAYRGVRAANVPLVPSVKPPEELTRLAADKVIALTMNPQRLAGLRRTRAEHIGVGPLGEYENIRQVTQELRQANAAFAKHGWRTIDVSYKSVEEVAVEILRMCK